MREGTILLFGRLYSYRFHFGLKSICLLSPCDPLKEDWGWTTAAKNYDAAPAFVRKAIAKQLVKA